MSPSWPVTPRRTEPQIGAPGPTPLRMSSPRAVATRPAVPEAPRFGGETRSAHEPMRLTLSAPERLTVSSAISEKTGPSGGALRFLALAILIGLAAIGAATLLHYTLGGILPF